MGFKFLNATVFIVYGRIARHSLFKNSTYISAVIIVFITRKYDEEHCMLQRR